MQRVGDESAGFSVEVDWPKGTVEVSGWGFWNVEVSRSFARTVLDAAQQAPGAKLILDMSALKPVRDEGQAAFLEVFAGLELLSRVEARVVTASHLTKLQLQRLAREAAVLERVRFS